MLNIAGTVPSLKAILKMDEANKKIRIESKFDSIHATIKELKSSSTRDFENLTIPLAKFVIRQIGNAHRINNREVDELIETYAPFVDNNIPDSLRMRFSNLREQRTTIKAIEKAFIDQNFDVLVEATHGVPFLESPKFISWFESSILNLLSELKDENVQKARQLIEEYAKILPHLNPKSPLDTRLGTNTPIDIRQAIAGNALHMLLSTNLETSFFDIISKILPEEITHPELAYNLACWYSRQRNVKDMLRHIKIAVRLGSTPDSFQKDPDFEFYSKQQLFLAAIAKPNQRGNEI